MLLTIFAVIACAAVLTVLASMIVTWSSNQSAFWNMGFGVLLALAAIAVVVVIAWFLARAALPR